jgi:colicin import membrane protein
MSNELVAFKNLDPVEVFKSGGVQPLIDLVRKELSSEVPDVSTDAGRKRIASRAFLASKSKTALDKLGKDLADELNEKLKPINTERKLARDEFDKMRDETRQPLTDWEKEQEDVAAAELAKVEAMRLAKQKEDDQEIAILLDYKFNSEAAAALAKLEADRIAYEEQLRVAAVRAAKAEALAETARIAADYAEKESLAAERENQLRINAKKAEAARILAEENAAQVKLDAVNRAKEQVRQTAINEKNAEKRRVAAVQAANHLNVKRQKAEVQRLATEQKARDDDKVNRTKIDRFAVLDLMRFAKLTEDQAETVVVAIAKNKISRTAITY